MGKCIRFVLLVIIGMKLLSVFLLIVLVSMARAQLLPSKWQIVTDGNSQSIWNQLGLKQISGRCRWKWQNQLIIKLYWQNVADNYLEMTLYVYKGSLNNPPTFSGRVNVTYKYYQGGIRQSSNQQGEPYIILKNQALQITQHSSTLKIQFQQMETTSFKGMCLIQLAMKIILILIILIRTVEKIAPDQHRSYLSQSKIPQRHRSLNLSLSFLSALNAWELYFAFFIISDQCQQKLGVVVEILVLVLHFGFQVGILISFIILEIQIKEFKYVAVYFFIWIFGSLFSLQCNLLLFSLFPLIQIQQNYAKNQKSFNFPYTVLYYSINIILGIYMIGCPVNFLRHRINYALAVVIIVLAVIQVLVLYIQEIVGPRFWLQERSTAQQKLAFEKNISMNAECPHCFKSLTLKAILGVDKQDIQKIKGV